jgi:beta-mannosidase
VAAWTWIDHPAGTIGVFVDNATGVPSNGFYLIPGIPRTRTQSIVFFSIRRFTLIWVTVRFVLNTALSAEGRPDPADFVVRSLWNNTHV